MAIAETARPELSAREIHLRTGDSLRTVQARISAWFARQDDPSVPRVRRAHVASVDRWSYLVDADSYEAFVLGELPAGEIPACASERARLLGCSCEIVHLHDGPGAMIAQTCPVHGMLVAV
jgi:hypothetical protein